MAKGLKTSPPVLCASDIMTKQMVTLHPEQDVFEAISLLAKKKISGAPVVDENGLLLGMFTEKCCLEVLVGAAYDSLPTNEVGKYMIECPLSIDRNMQLMSIARVFINQPVRRLPVVHEGKLIGQISRCDVIRHAADFGKPKKSRGSATLYLSALSNKESLQS